MHVVSFAWQHRLDKAQGHSDTAQRWSLTAPKPTCACTYRETAHLAVRMLTARAAGVVLRNISQVDSFKAAWLEEYFSTVGGCSSRC